MLKHLRLVARRRHNVETHAVDRNGANWRRYVSIFAFATAVLANPMASQCQGMPGGQPASGDLVERGDGRSNARTTIVVDGNCTLVDAITAANTDAPAGSCGAGNGADTIELTGDVTLTERDNVDRGNNGLPVVTTEVLLDGRGHTIRRSSGAIPFRLFRIAVDPSLPDDEPAPSLTLLNTTVTGGRLEDSSHGGAISNGAGSYLTLIDSTVSDSYVDNGAGGGIYNRGTMDLIGTTVTANIARGFRAGGIENTGKATLTSSTISANMGSYGGSGGGVNSLGVLTLINSTVSGNSGDLVAKRVTAPRAFVLGNNLSATLTQKIPETAPLEVFTLVAEINEMQQGTARAEAEFLVVAPEP